MSASNGTTAVQVQPQTPDQPKDNSQPFTCTFCWHPSTQPPQIIGLSSRLACQACYIALINLSICWVCGELIFRGDECVSLGWCFWHRACYGCLLCGSPMVVRGARVQELFAGEDRGRAREVEEVPLCAQCYVEVEGEGKKEREGGEGTVVDRALRRMEYYEGGLGRRRWEARRKEKASSERHGGDGTLCEPAQSGHAPLGSTIYVSIHDPINQPSFKPSPTKPIPRWMDPSRPKMPEMVVQQPRPVVVEPLLSPVSPTLTGRSQSRPSTPPTQQTPPADIIPRPVSTPPYSTDTSTAPQHMRYSRAGIISAEPLKRPSSRLGHVTNASDQQTPYPSPPAYPPPLSEAIQDYFLDRDKSLDAVQESLSHPTSLAPPPPRVTRPQAATGRSTRDSPFFSARVGGRSKSPAFLKAKMAFEKAGTAAMPMSSEYIERYRPVRPPSRVASVNATPIPTSPRKYTRTQKAAPIMATVSRAWPSVDVVNEATLSAAADRPGSPEAVGVESLVQGLHDIQEHGGGEKRTSFQAGIGRLFGR